MSLYVSSNVRDIVRALAWQYCMLACAQLRLVGCKAHCLRLVYYT